MTTMDAVERQRFVETARDDKACRDEVRRELLTDKLLELPQTVATFAGTVAELGRDITALVETVAGLGPDITALRADIRIYVERMLSIVTEFGEQTPG